jgi:hypothetical protein
MPPSPQTPEIVEQFTSWPLHDAVLRAVHVDWQARTCIAEIDAFVARDKEAVSRQILWHGVREVHIPHDEPWGRSASINEARLLDPGVFILQMQSGDEIRIRADTVEFVTPQT